MECVVSTMYVHLASDMNRATPKTLLRVPIVFSSEKWHILVLGKEHKMGIYPRPTDLK